MILILDKESKDSLGAKFFKTMWPYRRNKTLNFGYMFIEKGQSWFMDILQQATDDADRTQNINPKNCVGTVLALNGHRRYFCMYHAKHPEGQRKSSEGGTRRRRRRRRRRQPGRGGASPQNRQAGHQEGWSLRRGER